MERKMGRERKKKEKKEERSVLGESFVGGRIGVEVEL